MDDLRPKRGRPLKSRSSRPMRSPPWAARPDAMATAAKAAAAVGMSIEELADLLVEGGITATIPKDDVVQRYTIEDLGKALWAHLQETPKTKRQEWFASLTPVQQKSLIVVLRDQGFHFEVIAVDLGISIQKVIETWNHHCDQLGAQVVGVRLETIAGQLQVHASRAQHMAVQAHDHNGFWRISKDYVELLQSLGIVDRAIHRVEHTHSMQDDHKAEIEALVTLEEKKRRRLLELKEVDATVVASEPLPDLADDYDNEAQEVP